MNNEKGHMYIEQRKLALTFWSKIWLHWKGCGTNQLARGSLNGSSPQTTDSLSTERFLSLFSQEEAVTEDTTLSVHKNL